METVKKQIEVVDHFKVDLYLTGFQSDASDHYGIVNHSISLMDNRGNTFSFPANRELIENLIGNRKNTKLSFEVRIND